MFAFCTASLADKACLLLLFGRSFEISHHIRCLFVSKWAIDSTARGMLSAHQAVIVVEILDVRFGIGIGIRRLDYLYR